MGKNYLYTLDYIRNLPLMQEKVGKAIDACEGLDEKENLIDLYNNIQLEIDEIQLVIGNDQVQFTQHVGMKPSRTHSIPSYMPS